MSVCGLMDGKSGVKWDISENFDLKKKKKRYLNNCLFKKYFICR